MKAFPLFILAIVGPSFVHMANAQSLNGVRSWAYVLQEIDLPSLANSQFDLAVIDYSQDGSEAGKFSAEDIDELHASGKIVLSYLSIGEAEDYRYYFQANWTKQKRRSTCGVRLTKYAPSWLDTPNKNWCGNYKVRFWDSSWQRILLGAADGPAKSYLDRIIDAGFDGVYLDIVDAYEYWLEKRGKKRRKTAAADMANLVIHIADYARNTRGKPSFYVVPQNGLGIIDELSEPLRSAYLRAISGVAAEDVFYYGSADENNRLNPQYEAINYLQQYENVGLPVFVIDYLTSPSLVNHFERLSCDEHFVPQVAVRDLNSLQSNLLGACPLEE